MNTLIQCLVLLACAAISTSSPLCRCIKTSSFVLPSLIAGIEVHDPGPFCNKRVVIVVLKDKSKVCLDPAGKFAEAVLRTIAKRKAGRANEMKTTFTKTTTEQGMLITDRPHQSIF